MRRGHKWYNLNSLLGPDDEKKKVIIPRILKEYVTNINGDGGEHSPTEKRRVEARRSSEETPKESVSFQG